MNGQLWFLGSPVASVPGASIDDKISYLKQLDTAQMTEFLLRPGSYCGHAKQNDVVVLQPTALTLFKCTDNFEAFRWGFLSMGLSKITYQKILAALDLLGEGHATFDWKNQLIQIMDDISCDDDE